VALLEKFRVDQDTAAGQEALAAFERALQIDPDAPLAPLDRFIALSLLGRDDQAEEAADRLLQRQPDEPMVLVNLAQWHMGHRRWDQAATLLQQALATGRAPPSAATDLATCLQQLSARTSSAPAPPKGG
jgi:Flp pilus assembly protein TadD